MRVIRNFPGQALLFLLSLVGAGIAIYLTTVHYENVPLICSASGLVDCARVLSSSYSVIPFIPTGVLLRDCSIEGIGAELHTFPGCPFVVLHIAAVR